MKHDPDAFVPDPSPNAKKGYHTKHTVQWYYPSHSRERTDAEQLRELYGIPELNVQSYIDRHKDAICYPDMVIHEAATDYSNRVDSTKGTDGLFEGHRDSGKTTFALNLAVRLMEQNQDLRPEMDPVADGNMNRVVWRGRKRGSGWLAFRHWTTLYLPSRVAFEMEWVDADIEDATVEREDLEDIVREVVYYDGIYDLLEKLADRAPGSFNVVYPDPLFRDCHTITKRTNNGQFAGGLEFTPTEAAGEDKPATPKEDWWAPFLVARTETDYLTEWTSWICDEAGDLFPENAPNNKGRNLAGLISMLKGAWAASRKRRLSLFMFVHHEADLHWKIRQEFKWRVDMPDGSSNPIASRSASHPVGFEGDIPMEADIMGNLDRDEFKALCYDRSGWAEFSWSNIEPVIYDDDRWLSILPTTESSRPRPKGNDPESPAPDGDATAIGGGFGD